MWLAYVVVGVSRFYDPDSSAARNVHSFAQLQMVNFEQEIVNNLKIHARRVNTCIIEARSMFGFMKNIGSIVRLVIIDTLSLKMDIRKLFVPKHTVSSFPLYFRG
jgi:hypothetical protein